MYVFSENNLQIEVIGIICSYIKMTRRLSHILIALLLVLLPMESYCVSPLNQLRSILTRTNEPKVGLAGGLNAFSQRVKVFQADVIFYGNWTSDTGSTRHPFNGFENNEGDLYLWFEVDDTTNNNVTSVIVNFRDEVFYCSS